MLLENNSSLLVSEEFSLNKSQLKKNLLNLIHQENDSSNSFKIKNILDDFMMNKKNYVSYIDIYISKILKIIQVYCYKTNHIVSLNKKDRIFLQKNFSLDYKIFERYLIKLCCSPSDIKFGSSKIISQQTDPDPPNNKLSPKSRKDSSITEIDSLFSDSSEEQSAQSFIKNDITELSLGTTINIINDEALFINRNIGQFDMIDLTNQKSYHFTVNNVFYENNNIFKNHDKNSESGNLEYIRRNKRKSLHTFNSTLLEEEYLYIEKQIKIISERLHNIRKNYIKTEDKNQTDDCDLNGLSGNNEAIRSMKSLHIPQNGNIIDRIRVKDSKLTQSVCVSADEFHLNVSQDSLDVKVVNDTVSKELAEIKKLKQEEEVCIENLENLILLRNQITLVRHDDNIVDEFETNMQQMKKYKTIQIIACIFKGFLKKKISHKDPESIFFKASLRKSISNNIFTNTLLMKSENNLFSSQHQVNKKNIFKINTDLELLKDIKCFNEFTVGVLEIQKNQEEETQIFSNNEIHDKNFLNFLNHFIPNYKNENNLKFQIGNYFDQVNVFIAK